MLVRLLPDDIGKRWPLIREAILDDLPSRISDGIRDDENAISSLLYALLDGTLHCWLSVEYEGGKPEIKAIITTTIVIDAPSGIKNLLMYSITTFQELSRETVMDSYKSLQEFARSMKCFKIISLTDNPENIKLAESMGGKATQTLIEMEVDYK